MKKAISVIKSNGNETMLQILTRMKVKGRDFDLNGVITPFADLCKTDAIYEFNDICARLPFPEGRIREWMENASFSGVFYFLDSTGKGQRRTPYIDLQAFVAALNNRLSTPSKQDTCKTGAKV